MMKLSVFAASLTTVALLMPMTSEAVLDARQDSKPAASEESRAYLHGYNLPSSGLALEGYCPVAYFAVNKPVLGKPEFASTHNEVTYYFVNADAKKAFDKEPEKYLPAYGGWCAFGMAVEDKFPVDPRLFKIVDGRLFLFLKNKNVDALEIWNKGEETELIEKADAHWAKVSG
ncbi:MAG: YHS domain-containing (seleno)protein [Planctomycetota bacterium]|jgi:YHS domain-containing protein